MIFPSPTYIHQAITTFDNLMRETLADLASSLLDWAWLKASLPCSLGALNLHRASLHAPAVYISFLNQNHHLVLRILGHPPATPSPLAEAESDLANMAKFPDWTSIEDINMPLSQWQLSWRIDEASFQSLPDSVPDEYSWTLTLSVALPHVGDWLNVVPSSALGLCLLDVLLAWPENAQGMSQCNSCTYGMPLILLVTTMWAVEAMATEYTDMMPSEMSFTLLHRLWV